MSRGLDDHRLTLLILKYTPRDRRRKVNPEDQLLVTALKELREWRDLHRRQRELAEPDRSDYDD